VGAGLVIFRIFPNIQRIALEFSVYRDVVGHKPQHRALSTVL
jgi:hypothetical protein